MNTDDLIDARMVADILGLTQRNAVSLYLKRYPDMPRPVVDIPSSKTRLWLRHEVEAWNRDRDKRPRKPKHARRGGR